MTVLTDVSIMLCDTAFCRLKPWGVIMAAGVLEQLLNALLGSMVLALPAQPPSVCAQVQQPLVPLLTLALPAQFVSVCAQEH